MDLHRVRFIEHDPKTINSLAFSDATEPPRLAISRSDSSIELWVTQDDGNFYPDRLIPGRNDSSVETLVWNGSRLFSAGLSGHIHDWDLISLRPRETLNAPGGAVWCLQANTQRTLLAAGCEDGLVLLLDITEDNFLHIRNLNRQEGRLLSLAWQPAGDYIMVGGADSTIRKMNVKTGRCVLRITVNEFYYRKTLVWDLKFLGTHTVVSADSLGNIQFWNCKHGTLKQSLLLHKADVLSLAVSKDENTIFAAGADPKIVRLQRVDEKSSTWVKTGEVEKLSHDIKAMVVTNNKFLVAGGVGTQFTVSPVSNFIYHSTVRYSPFFNCSKRFSVAAAARMFMFQSNTSLKLWKIPLRDESKTRVSRVPATCSEKTEASGDTQTGSKVAVSDSSWFNTTSGLPVNLLDINIKGPLHILSSAISDDGSLVALSTVEKLWLYTIDTRDPNVQCLREDNLPCYKMAFAVAEGGETKLVLATIGQGVKVISVSIDEAAARPLDHEARVLEGREESRKGSCPITDFEISSDGGYIATMDVRKQMYLFSLETYQLLAKLPRFEGQPVSFAFDAASLNLILFSAPEKEMFAYRIPEESLVSIGTLEDSQQGRKKKWLAYPSGLVSLAGKENIFALYDTRSLNLICCPGNDASTPKKAIGRKRKKEGRIQHQSVRSSLQQLVLYVASLSGSELIVVERPWTEIIKSFPPVLIKEKYKT